MKTITSILFSLLLSLSFNTKAAEFEPLNNLGDLESMSPCTLRINLCYTITGYIGKGSPCRDLSFQCLFFDKCKRTADLNLNNVEQGSTKIIIDQVSQNEISMKCFSKDVSSGYFEVEKNYYLPDLICKDLGLSRAFIPAGKYKSSLDPSGFWKTIFPIKF